MTALVSPIHVEAVGVADIRLFAPPSGRREFPWVSIDDLHASLSLPRMLRREFRHKLRSGEWRNFDRTVATADGIVNIVLHIVAQGVIDAMKEVGWTPAEFYTRYAAAGAQAMGKLTAGFSPPELLATSGMPGRLQADHMREARRERRPATGRSGSCHRLDGQACLRRLAQPLGIA